MNNFKKPTFLYSSHLMIFDLPLDIRFKVRRFYLKKNVQRDLLSN